MVLIERNKHALAVGSGNTDEISSTRNCKRLLFFDQDGDLLYVRCGIINGYMPSMDELVKIYEDLFETKFNIDQNGYPRFTNKEDMMMLSLRF